ncbi:Protein-S-isoprenylcysteine O-methyltransferase Ste14 [bacterium JGI 053]|nr:Protein-S-isoprenylcysteine O-methyltransferase Ste14 [bacterium JGI 053]
MTSRQDLIAQGNWLFRNRSWVPLVALAGLLAALPFSPPPPAGRDRVLWEGFCIALSLTGLLVRAAAIGCKPRGTSGRNRRVQNAQVLNTTGLYSIVRHPLYLGNALMWSGIAIFPRVWAAAVFVGVFFWVFYERVMLAEEDFLRFKFGAEYERWADRTPAFIPAPARWCPPELPFSLRAVLKAEYPGFLAVAIVFTALRVGLDLAESHRLVLRPFWIGFLAAGVLAYVVLRTLRKHTAVLQIQGR